MTTEAQLLAEILAHPEDDAPRLVYADLLLARGDVRGEMIQLQCAAARLPRHAPEREALEDQASVLYERHGIEWEEPVQQHGAIVTRFARGFPESAQLLGTIAIADDVAKVRAAAPLRWLRLGIAPDARHDPPPDLAGLTGVAIEVKAGRALQTIAAALAGWSFAELPELEVTGLGDRGAVTVASHPTVAGLRTLEAAVRSDGLDALASSTALPGLEALALRLEGTGEAATDAFLASPRAAALHRLEMQPRRFGTPPIPWLVPSLRRLVWHGYHPPAPNTYDAPLSGAVVAALAGLTWLEELSLSHTPLVQQLDFPSATSPLRALTLRRCPSAQLPRLCLRPSGLERLALPENRLDATRCQELAEVGHDHLRVLDLSWNPVEDAGLAAIARARLPALRELELRGVDVGADGLAALGLSPLADQLRSLTIGGRRIDAAAVAALIAPGRLRGLRDLEIETDDRDGVRTLTERLPWVSRIRIRPSREG